MAVTAPRAPRTTATPTTRTEKGISFARGPALVLGTILLVVGLYFLYRQHRFPPFSNFPNGHAPVDGRVLFTIFGANGWTGMLTAAGGGLLLFGAAQHLLAKTMSLIVGVAFGAAAIIALISGNVLGMAAADGRTELGWGIVAAILLINTLVPRRRREVAVADEPAITDRQGRSARIASPARTAAPASAAVDDPRAVDETDPAGDERTDPTTGDDPALRVAGDERAARPTGDEPAAAASVDDLPAGRAPSTSTTTSTGERVIRTNAGAGDDPLVRPIDDPAAEPPADDAA